MPRYDRRSRLRRSCVSLWLVCWLGGAAAAQDVTTFLDPPRDPDGTYGEAMPRRVAADIRYVDETNVDFLTGDRPERRVDVPLRGFEGANYGTFLMIALVVALLFIFVKFGAGGMLLRADPSAPKKPRKRAKAWGLTAADHTAGDIMAQVRVMASRREALIFLLRHCLLQAADETQTNFLRADTERDALARLPTSWRRHGQLHALMFQTELVHYGGRDIADDAFDAAIDHGSQILMARR
ncbi:hypothetical protein [Yoonia sp.]|jgi:hypothetical protein|uniref:hypothetical protein n=1 Tax=Yoonia sp. TaxID=2212373 RepID=UPI0026001597|nr:hypothetical protein [Yoonia sp.]